MAPEEYIAIEAQYGAHNYKPLPVVLSRGEGVMLYDVDDKPYYDFLSAYSAVNQGHCHPRLVAAMVEQASRLTLTSRAFYNDQLGHAEQFLAETFHYDKVLMMNSGAEAVETAIKLARRWGYLHKGIPNNEAIILVVSNNFHGRTTGIIGFSTDTASKNAFGPYAKGFYTIPFNNLEVLETALQMPNVCGFLVEPIQGEAGVIVPADGYLAGAQELCKKHNALFITDEVQTGLARTGRMLATDYENIKGDILILGKALSGGMMPISCVLADDEVMLGIKPGEHGSTFGGNPLAARLAIESVKVLQDENLANNAFTLGELFRSELRKIDAPILESVRGKGLLNAIKLHDPEDSQAAYKLCLAMKDRGLLAKQTHGNVIRFAPPLVITREQLLDGVSIITDALRSW